MRLRPTGRGSEIRNARVSSLKVLGQTGVEGREQSRRVKISRGLRALWMLCGSNLMAEAVFSSLVYPNRSAELS